VPPTKSGGGLRYREIGEVPGNSNLDGGGHGGAAPIKKLAEEMQCVSFQAKLIAFLDRELPSEEVAGVERVISRAARNAATG